MKSSADGRADIVMLLALLMVPVAPLWNDHLDGLADLCVLSVIAQVR